MEVYCSSIPNLPQFFSRNSVLSPKFCLTSLNNRNSHRYKIPISKFTLYSPFSTSETKKFQISAHFGRASNRRNSLRKKLIDDQQVSRSPISLDPNRNFHDSASFLYDLDYDGVKGSDSSNGVSEGIVDFSNVEESELKSKKLGNPVLLSKLEKWADQYKKDIEMWGIGTGPIFTIFQDLEGNVKRVVVNDDEILSRSGEFVDSTKVNLKISHAKYLAKEMESRSSVIPKNSSVAKFVVTGEQNGFLNVIRSVTMRPDFYSKLSRVGIAVFCGLFVFWAVKSLFSIGKNNVELMRLEKEMLRRKMKSRMEKENMEKGSVEVIQDPLSQQVVFAKRPKLDKQEVLNTILNAKGSRDILALMNSSSSMTTKAEDMDNKLQEIREMARTAREIEGANSSLLDRDEEEEDLAVNEKLSNEMEVVNQQGEEGANFLSNGSHNDSRQTWGINGRIGSASLDKLKGDDIGFLGELPSTKSGDMEAPTISSVKVLEERQTKFPVLKDDSTLDFLDKREVTQNSGSPQSHSCLLETGSSKTKPQVIRSVKEAREYLSRKRDKQESNQEGQVSTVLEGTTILSPQPDIESTRNIPKEFDNDDRMCEPRTLGGTPDIAPEAKGFEDSTMMRNETLLTKHTDLEDADGEYGMGDFQKPRTSQDYEGSGSSAGTGPSVHKENWLEKNFHELEPVVKKIRDGFRKNYEVAKERDNQELNICSEMNHLGMNEDDSELDWMKDDHLREVVFQVRENELAGWDPFHMMDAEDKAAFFEGLERKVEKENKELLNVHEWVHSNIENLDYGADGISIYDSPEKFIPRWKGPPLEKSPEYLNNFVEQRKAFLDGKAEIPYPVNDDEVVSLQKSKESPSQENLPISSIAYDRKNKLTEGALKNEKIVIEGSDGSVRTGKKSGKEYWQHTKKWSHGFLESYNAETDPEVKSIMKDMGKDLDRWINEKEVKEAAELMTRLPEKNKEFIEKKLEKLKREMELFGPQAVASKYREYAEEKEEDHLWWLDLPFVLCIELYTNDNGEQRIGFYSLEMAADLELEPKQYHVVAFEDSGDCKNFCYTIQAHMEMLGNGDAFVIARPPKDAFREAKANGFSVTVIRKGELQLNVDQTLEEVEENISEIGSKIYHDKITRERSVDISSLMKGVFGVGKSTKRRRSKKRKVLGRLRSSEGHKP